MPIFSRSSLRFLLPAVVSLTLCSCMGGGQQQQQVKAPEKIGAYAYRKGETAVLMSNGKAVAPPGAPPQVKRAIEAANKIVGKPYRMGGGHKVHDDNCYDCSGSVSYVLREAGLLTSVRHSPLFLRYGQKGEGRWISIYAKNGHVFMVICGLRFDTSSSGRGGQRGPAWRTSARSSRGFVVRHPRGF